jgi:hypothetical protein
LTYKSKFGGFSYVSEFLEFDRTNENKAIWAQNKIFNMAANIAVRTELKYNKFSYISKLRVESHVSGLTEFNGETKNGIKLS